MITNAQCRGARGLIGFSQRDLAEAAEVAHRTLADFETGTRSPHPRTLDAIQAALEAAGVIFIDANGEGPGVRLRKGADDK
jgi:transcriptional regulator with XRE-family HTH domain